MSSKDDPEERVPKVKAPKKAAAKKPAKKKAATKKPAKKKAAPKPPPPPPKQTFPGISPRAYEHPTDRAALVALRKVPGFDLVVRKLFGLIGDRTVRLATLGSAVRVSEKQFPDLHASYMEACAVLDVQQVPELYVAQTPLVNAGAVGVDKPFIVLNSGSLMLLSPDELQFVLGHELGHVLSGHVLYKTMLSLLMRASILALSVPLGGAALFAIVAALLEWDRKSELSADRCGLLVVQDPNVAMSVHMKLAGGGSTSQMSIDEFIKQAEEYQQDGGVLDSVIKFLNLIGRRHPFSVLRLAELKKWVDGGGYEVLLGGSYPRRDSDEGASLYEEVKESGRSYGEDFGRSKEPIASFFRGVGADLQDVSGSFSSFLRRNLPGKGGDG